MSVIPSIDKDWNELSEQFPAWAVCEAKIQLTNYADNIQVKIAVMEFKRMAFNKPPWPICSRDKEYV